MEISVPGISRIVQNLESIEQRLKLEVLPLVAPRRERAAWINGALIALNGIFFRYERTIEEDKSHGTASDAIDTLTDIKDFATRLAVAIRRASWEALERISTPGDDLRKGALWEQVSVLKIESKFDQMSGPQLIQMADGSMEYESTIRFTDHLLALAELAKIGVDELTPEFGMGGKRPYHSRFGNPDFRLVKDCYGLIKLTKGHLKNARDVAAKIREIATGNRHGDRHISCNNLFTQCAPRDQLVAGNNADLDEYRLLGSGSRAGWTDHRPSVLPGCRKS
jgi:hypothetical protein